MVWHHVAKRAGGIIEPPARSDIERFRHGDLHVVDVIAVPQRLENAVGESENENVLNRLFAEVVVDPINLAFGEHGQNVTVEGLRRWQIDAERLFDDHPSPMPVLLAHEIGGAELLHDRGEHLGRRREVEQNVAVGVVGRLGLAQELREVCEGRRIVEFATQVVETLGEPTALILLRGAGVITETQFAPERLVVPISSCDADHREFFRQQTGAPKVLERRHEQAFREITGGAEDDEDARICRPRLRLHFTHPTWVQHGRRIRVASPRAACRQRRTSPVSGSARRAPMKGHPLEPPPRSPPSRSSGPRRNPRRSPE